MDDQLSAPARGKILKVRLGYNANSSSLSAIVSLLLLGSAAATTTLAIINAAIYSKAPPAPKPPTS